MTDFLSAVDSDVGKKEPIPVTLASGGAEVGTSGNPLSVAVVSGGGGSSGGLTDAELRASPVPVSGPLTDTQLRASAIGVSSADGGQVTIGAKADAAATTDAGTFSLIALIKRLLGKIPALGQATMANSLPVALASNQSALATTVADGASVTMGAVADAAYAGSGSSSLVAALKGIYAACVAATPAGENHIGKFGGETKVATATPTVSTSPAYSSGDVIGSLMTFSGIGRVTGGTGIIQMVTIMCKSAQAFACDLVLFHTNPSSSTFTDNAAVAVNTADYDKIIGVFSLSAGSWTSLGTPSVGQLLQSAPYKVAAGQSDIYGVLVARGTPTLASTSDLTIAVKALQD
jgi:hypothetical protein